MKERFENAKCLRHDEAVLTLNTINLGLTRVHRNYQLLSDSLSVYVIRVRFMQSFIIGNDFTYV
jgi:hypothetical protein